MAGCKSPPKTDGVENITSWVSDGNKLNSAYRRFNLNNKIGAIVEYKELDTQVIYRMYIPHSQIHTRWKCCDSKSDFRKMEYEFRRNGFQTVKIPPIND